MRSRTNAVGHAGVGSADDRDRDPVVRGHHRGQRHAAPARPAGLVIGRGNEADLRIDDPGISRRHAQISLKESEGGTIVTVADLGSTNGVILDGQPVDSSPVRDGSEIRLGNTVIVIRITPKATPDQPSEDS